MVLASWLALSALCESLCCLWGLELYGGQGDGRGCLVCSRVGCLDLELRGDCGQHRLGDRSHGLWLVGLGVLPPMEVRK